MAIDMRFATEAEVTEAREHKRACGHTFDTAKAALVYLERATLTWRNPDWAAADREEGRAAEIAGMPPPGED